MLGCSKELEEELLQVDEQSVLTNYRMRVREAIGHIRKEVAQMQKVTKVEKDSSNDQNVQDLREKEKELE